MKDLGYFDRNGFTGDSIGDVLIWNRNKFNEVNGWKSELDRLNIVLEEYGGHYCNSLNSAMFEAKDFNSGLVYGCLDRRTDYEAEANADGGEWVSYRNGYVSRVTGEYVEDPSGSSYPVWCIRRPSFRYQTAGEEQSGQGSILLEMLIAALSGK